LFYKFNDELNKEYSPIPDIWIPEKNLVIEIYGDYWHANPNMYKSEDIFYTYDGKISAKDIWLRDDIRIKHIQNFNVFILLLWEQQIKNGEYKETINEYL